MVKYVTYVLGFQQLLIFKIATCCMHRLLCPPSSISLRTSTHGRNCWSSSGPAVALGQHGQLLGGAHHRILSSIVSQAEIRWATRKVHEKAHPPDAANRWERNAARPDRDSRGERTQWSTPSPPCFSSIYSPRLNSQIDRTQSQAEEHSGGRLPPPWSPR
jgi:hypothetical protein